jgi:hypothetical protein
LIISPIGQYPEGLTLAWEPYKTERGVSTVPEISSLAGTYLIIATEGVIVIINIKFFCNSRTLVGNYGLFSKKKL